MSIFSFFTRKSRKKKLIELECKVAGLKAKLQRTEQLASQMKEVSFDIKAIEITEELWKTKRELQIKSEENV